MIDRDRFSQARVEKSLDRLIQKMDGANPETGRPRDGFLGDVSTKPPRRSVPEGDTTSDTLEDGTLIKYPECSNSDSAFCGGIRGGGSSILTCPVISDNGHSPPSAPRGENHQQRHVYQRVSARDSSFQVNGDILSTLASVRTPKNYYSDVIASGRSRQINGNLDLEPFLELVRVR
jgi:hypothetical protein